MNNYLTEILEKLEQETGIESVGISTKQFSTESNNISQSQSNTIISLLLKVLGKLDYLESKIEKIIQELGIVINREKYKTEINLENLEERLEIIIRKVEQLPLANPRQNIKDILGPKIILK